MKQSIDATILENRRIQGAYFRVLFDCPPIASTASAGQFVHVRIDERLDRILRRPFSIQCVEPDKGTVAILYKVVGAGTETLSHKTAGERCNLLGPLGRGFTAPKSDEYPILIAGGYGSAATYLLSRHPVKGMLLLGARNCSDLLLVDE
ncbi:MAG: hypothetical protein PHS41_03075, partial [Victivallaceae bacterium]|nr:hypothetical protein [Victivallaceae bacterium]